MERMRTFDELALEFNVCRETASRLFREDAVKIGRPDAKRQSYRVPQTAVNRKRRLLSNASRRPQDAA